MTCFWPGCDREQVWAVWWGKYPFPREPEASLCVEHCTRVCFFTNANYYFTLIDGNDVACSR